ncbi:MAG: sugar phosphate nucleotidyltransferase [Planctomycetota bacterium]|nr:sugar phosphate nucleotidyltransferase [Planctomycetota bacterium]
MKRLAAIILAAGKGTRMNSDLPKVAHKVAGAPMVCWVVDACREVGCGRIVLVVGHRQEVIRDLFPEDAPDAAPIEFAEQLEQRGTAHAVNCAQPLLADFDGDVLVLCGDGPLIRAETLDKLIARHRDASASLTLATATVDDPTGYGRIVRDENGRFAAIVEQKNASDAQRRIREVNPSYYCFDAKTLFKAVAAIKPDAKSGEQYLTDVPDMLQRQGRRVEVIDAVPAEDALSINTPEQLAEADAILRQRLAATEARG